MYLMIVFIEVLSEVKAPSLSWVEARPNLSTCMTLTPFISGIGDLDDFGVLPKLSPKAKEKLAKVTNDKVSSRISSL